MTTATTAQGTATMMIKCIQDICNNHKRHDQTIPFVGTEGLNLKHLWLDCHIFWTLCNWRRFPCRDVMLAWLKLNHLRLFKYINIHTYTYSMHAKCSCKSYIYSFWFLHTHTYCNCREIPLTSAVAPLKMLQSSRLLARKTFGSRVP